jgi:hypothetical protein
MVKKNMLQPYQYYKLRDWIDNNKLNWNLLSFNPYAISLLEKNIDKINWYGLSGNSNPNAIHLLQQNIDKIDWYALSSNPNIFVLDYQAIKEDRKVLNEEIVQYFYHPTRMSKWIESGETMDDFINIYG